MTIHMRQEQLQHSRISLLWLSFFFLLSTAAGFSLLLPSFGVGIQQRGDPTTRTCLYNAASFGYVNGDDEDDDDDDDAALTVDLDQDDWNSGVSTSQMMEDNSSWQELDFDSLEFVPPRIVNNPDCFTTKTLNPNSAQQPDASSPYPFAAMLSGSAGYIASHAGKTAVVHVPGGLLTSANANGHNNATSAAFDSVMDDLALSWLLGMKLVVVVSCNPDDVDDKNANEQHMRPIDEQTLRTLTEDAGWLRFEVERRLHKSLKRHLGLSPNRDPSSGNVVGGNFFVASPFGSTRLQGDVLFRGKATKVYKEKINAAVTRGDIVLLTTVAPTTYGDLIHVQGESLAASVAAALQAHKLVYLAQQGRVVRQQSQEQSLQDIPLSFTQGLLKHYGYQVAPSGGYVVANSSRSPMNSRDLDKGTREFLHHLAWAAWAIERGVTRAHVVNPGDGALLEELFTAKHGANTCLFHDAETKKLQAVAEQTATWQDDDDDREEENGEDVYAQFRRQSSKGSWA